MRFANQEAYQNYQSSGMDATGGGKGSGGGYGGSRAIPARIDVKDVYNALQGYQNRMDRNNPNPQRYLQQANLNPSQTILGASPINDIALSPVQNNMLEPAAPVANTPNPRSVGYTPNPYTVDPVRPVPAMQTPRGVGYTPNPYTVDPVRPMQGLTPTRTTMGGGK